MQLQGPVYVYSGEGAWDLSVDLTCHMLEKVIDGRSIKRVDSLGELSGQTQLLVIPGGSYTDMYSELLRVDEKVQKYVSSGGKYLGICAGAILASDRRIGKPKSILGADVEIQDLHRQGFLYERESIQVLHPFSFHRAGCIAPHIVRNSKEAGSIENLCAVDVFFEGNVEPFKAFHYSGPVFFDVPKDVKVLVRYRDPLYLQKVRRIYDRATNSSIFTKLEELIYEEAPVAAFSGSCGLGRFVLTGIHPEIDCNDFASFAETRGFGYPLPVELATSELYREEFVSKIFLELDLEGRSV